MPIEDDREEDREERRISYGLAKEVLKNQKVQQEIDLVKKLVEAAYIQNKHVQKMNLIDNL